MEIRRRTVVKGVASLPLAAILADPLIARAVAAGLDTVTIKTQGGRSVGAALALPAKTPAPTILLVHEWWGLNDQIKSVAAEFAKQGYAALAIDLYGGKMSKDPAGARALMGAAMKSPKAMTETLVAWAEWLKKHDKGTGKIGTVGWCFGGGWSLNTAIATPVDATIIYYGNVARKAADLKTLKGPVLGHFATRDGWINKKMVGAWEAEMRTAGKAFTSHWYEADHAFANPTNPRHDKADAQLAWQRTLGFYKAHLS